MAAPTLVFEVLTDIPGVADAGDFLVCEPGAVPPEADLLRVTPLPRGRLGRLLGADADGAIRLCDPPASSVPVSELLLQLFQPASPA
jgi:hypothetical protein